MRSEGGGISLYFIFLNFKIVLRFQKSRKKESAEFPYTLRTVSPTVQLLC